MRLIDDFDLAAGWLTRYPIRFRSRAPVRALGSAVWAFPLVAVLVAAPALLALVIVQRAEGGALLGAALAVAAAVWITGALHEDGFADFLDGQGARGGPAERLKAMRDSQLGTYGGIGLMLILLVRVGALASMIDADPRHAVIGLVAAMVVGRTAMVPVLAWMPPARTDGAAKGAGQVTDRSVFIALVLGTLLFRITTHSCEYNAWATLWMILAVGLVVWSIVRRARRTLGGQTGDVLGAISLSAETAVLVIWSL